MNNLTVFFCVVSFIATNVFAADDRPQSPEKKDLVQRLLGHRRMPTQVQEQLKIDQMALVKQGLNKVEKRILCVIDEMRVIRDRLRETQDSDLSWDMLYPYDTVINGIAVCQVALMTLYHGVDVTLLQDSNARAEFQSMQDLLRSVKNRSEQFRSLNEDHQFRMLDAFFVKPKSVSESLDRNQIDYERCRKLWQDHNLCSISIMFDGIGTFDEFATRLFGMPIDIFIPLIRKRRDPDVDHGPHQGWKLHISATADSAFRVAKTVLPELARLNVDHKIVGSVKFLDLLKADPTQKGKFITIYPKNNIQAAQIAVLMNRLLTEAKFEPTEFDQVPNDAQLGNTGGLSVRYGAFSGLILTVLDDQGDPLLENGFEKIVRDKRDGNYKPDFILSHPFGDLLKNPLRNLLKRQNAKLQLQLP